MRAIGKLQLVLGLLMAAAPAAADVPVVVELFTSQGCSSCPPADALLGELAEREDVIPLGLHVDYWDYIGWEDTFALPQFTARQYGYARAADSTVVYTPQMVIGGQDYVIGYRPMDVADLIAAHREAPNPVAVELRRDGAGVIVRAEASMTPPAPEMVVQLVSYSPLERVDIRRGENRGRVIDYHNVVRSWQVIAEWDGREAFERRIQADGDAPLVIIVQQAGFGPILGAARLN